MMNDEEGRVAAQILIQEEAEQKIVPMTRTRPEEQSAAMVHDWVVEAHPERKITSGFRAAS
jgi:hypothetical protein